MTELLLAIDNIHCASCEEGVRAVVHKFDANADVQILPGREIVKIKSTTDFNSQDCMNELHASGFDVRDLNSDASEPITTVSPSQKYLPSTLWKLKSKLIGSRSVKLDKERVQSHSEICKACATPSEEPLDTFRAVFAVKGMTCSSCADSISTAVRASVPDALDISVDVVGGAVFVLCKHKEDANLIQTAIDDAGFDSVLTEVLPTRTTSTKQYRLDLAISGMTCSSCSSAVTSALEDLKFVTKATVDALDGRAQILTTETGHLDEIKNAVEDVGYGCEIPGDFVEVHISQSTQRARTVTIEVQGIYCDKCPERVMNALKEFGDAVHVVDQVSLKIPYVKFKYLPSPPKFTIRTILKELQEANPSLGFEIRKPKSLEELAAENQEREKQGIVKRLALTTLIAIPSTIIMLTGVMNTKLMFALATPVYFFADDMFHVKAIKDLKSLFVASPNRSLLRRMFHFGSMNLLMSLGTSISYWASVVMVFLDPNNHQDSYFDSVIFLTFFLLVGRYLDIYSKIKTTSAVSLVSKVRPDTVELCDNFATSTGDDLQDNSNDSSTNSSKNLPIELIEVGDYVAVWPGQRAGCDGLVVRGQSEMNESMLTGESLPVTKRVNDEVYSGTLNCGQQTLVYKVTAVGPGTLLNDIVDAVRTGQMKKAPIERYVEEITGIFVPVVIYLALGVWALWYTISKDFVWSMHFAISTFVVACPCGIGLAAPTALYIGSGLAAKYGILARGGGEAFQEGSRLEVVAFDKTGTITVGTGLHITDTWGAESDEALQLAARLESESTHPLAEAVIECAKGRKLTDDRCSNITKIDEGGRGMIADVHSGKFAGKKAILGNESAVLNVANATLTVEQKGYLQKWKSDGKSVIILAIKGDNESKIILMLAAADQIRPESRKVIHHLQDLNVNCYMISGDNVETAKSVARVIGIPNENVIANVLPQDKAAKIEQLQDLHMKRTVVAMVGDGVNDAPALATSDVGIALGRGADIALSSSQFVLLREDLRGIPVLIEISQAVMRKVKMNFFWAAIYNVIAIPVAAGALYPWTHRRLDPVWASLAMALSSVSVMASSLLLRRFKPADL